MNSDDLIRLTTISTSILAFFSRIIDRIAPLHRLLGKWRIGIDRLFISKTIKQLYWLSVLFVVVFFILLYGFGLDHNFLFKGMTSYDYESFKSDTIASFGLKLLYLVGVCFFSGFLVMILTNGVRNKIEKYIAGDVRYRFYNHVLIFGYNDIAEGVLFNLIDNLKFKGNIVLVAENNVRQIRETIEGKFGKQSNIFILHGNRILVSDLKSFFPERAHEIFIIGENEPNCDFINLDCYKYLSGVDDYYHNSKAYIYLFLHEQSSLTLINNRRYDNGDLKEIEFNDNKLRLLNTDERWARRILVDAANEWPDMNLNMRKGKRITMDSDYYVHLVIFGMTSTGEAIATTAAKTCHHPNFITKGLRTKITVIDNDFSHNRGVFYGRYFDFMEMCHYSINRIKDNTIEQVFVHRPKEEFDFLDIEWEFIESIPDDVQLQKLLISYAQTDSSLLSVVICGDDEAKNVSIALGLPKIYFDISVPIWVYTRSYSSLKHYLQNTRYDNIISWGMPGNLPTQELWEESAAKYFHLFVEQYYGDQSYSRSDINNLWDKTPMDVKATHITQMAAVPSIVGSMKNWNNNTPTIDLDDYELNVFMELEHIRWTVCALLSGIRPLDDNNTTDSIITDRFTQKKQFINAYITKYSNIPTILHEYDRDVINFYIDIINTKLQ